ETLVVIFGKPGFLKDFEEMTEVEKLKERVEYLEMENAALKKLRALVQEENARRTGSRRK
ncbi:hypothetical protein, partial [Exiguobacterium sp.]|uniref:hypothetical protein n=1 Tax=Exiguobacterium sp. TaxID=44751 RepID=UPI0028A23EAB